MFCITAKSHLVFIYLDLLKEKYIWIIKTKTKTDIANCNVFIVI